MLDSEETAEEFRLWLTAKEPDEIVGISANNQECPMATFSGARCVVGGWFTKDEYHRSFLGLEQPAHPYAPWAREFQDRIDHLNPHRMIQITAKQALTVLDDVLRDESGTSGKGEGE